MNKKNLYKLLICLLLISNISIVSAQEEDAEAITLTAATFDLAAATNDVIYLDSVVHMMDQSPLSSFPEYKKILFDGSGKKLGILCYKTNLIS